MRIRYRAIQLALLTVLLLHYGCSGIGRSGGQPTALVELGTPPGSYQITSGAEFVTIPFELFRSDIRMRVTINGRDCHFLVDNGNLWGELLFFGSPRIDSLGLDITGVTVLGDTAAENPILADVAEDITIGFGDLVFNGQTGIITRYIPGLPNPWEGADGQISAAFFKNFVVAVNFDESRLTLTPPDRFRYRGKGQAVPLHPGPLDSRTVTAQVAVTDDSVVDLELLVDLGGIYPLYLLVGGDSPISLPADAEEAVLGVGFGADRGYLGRISRLTIGGYTLENVPTAFKTAGEGASVFGDTMLGMPLLQRFNLVFDYFRGRLYLEPNRSFNDPF